MRACIHHVIFEWLHHIGKIKSLVPVSKLHVHQTRVRMASSSGTGTGHLDRTANNERHQVISPAQIKEVKNISPTVKQLRVHVMDSCFFFKAGQWVDMFIPGVDVVGGYSMCSAPHTLVSTGQLVLAVKSSPHPPAHWVHTKCKEGSEVKMRAGGDFFYDPPKHACTEDLLLLAGGVGVNPLFSILQHFIHLHPSQERDRNAGAKSQPKVSFLYSAQNMEELIFKEELKEIAGKNPNVNLKMHCTRQAVESADFISGGRIGQKDIELTSSQLDKSKAQVYICGPGSFIKSMELYCQNSGFNKSSIFYETWW
ncbi:oxidoreductase NAD-binding domain-containing protein 1 [Aplysia californica]|uniref:Oxidoreductase NAD-binding domain-containing protein 1 n=1 Tax=Aplysia californica TaxID=6500 RepID=A0ABM0JN06_APLCA|nr:oxidoreductase NAD-binding domain-containing protein 1 [Aplysia californica]